MCAISRREFLQAGTGAAIGTAVGAALLHRPVVAGLLRPPGAGVEARFLASCIRCSQCIEACPTDVLDNAPLRAGRRAGTPCVEARRQPCDLCLGRDAMQCIEVCPTDALEPLGRRADVRMGLAVVDTTTCLPHVGVSCRACWHACPFPDTAIRVDDNGRPEVNPAACVGCGLCEHACLTNPASIVVVPEREDLRNAAMLVASG